MNREKDEHLFASLVLMPGIVFTVNVTFRHSQFRAFIDVLGLLPCLRRSSSHPKIHAHSVITAFHSSHPPRITFHLHYSISRPPQSTAPQHHLTTLVSLSLSWTSSQIVVFIFTLLTITPTALPPNIFTSSS
ncbi:hypothetical protein GALMADRAFT_458249 [Galerina marginata CBS 339.88]|uniref:Uncharacterized protein n=1 Tax=Galerina marginata (strain CBS 339.88) TaxID=685588 RepID=A0A067T7Y4_GALM3|nr:hypothetical protein GALMADRAFT_458249 [Galerina marginata CBS 339.88]